MTRASSDPTPAWGRRFTAGLTALSLGGMALVGGAGVASAEDGGGGLAPTASIGDVVCGAEGAAVSVVLDNTASTESVSSYQIVVDGVAGEAIEVEPGLSLEVGPWLGADGSYEVAVQLLPADEAEVLLAEATVEVDCESESTDPVDPVEPVDPRDGDDVGPGDIRDVARATIGEPRCTDLGTVVDIEFDKTTPDFVEFRFWVDGEQRGLSYTSSRKIELLLGENAVYDVQVTGTFDLPHERDADDIGTELAAATVTADCDFTPVADPSARLDPGCSVADDGSPVWHIWLDNSRSNVRTTFVIEALEGEILWVMGGGEEVAEPGVVYVPELQVADGTLIQVTAASGNEGPPVVVLQERLTAECTGGGGLDSEDELADTGLETVHVSGVAVGLIGLGALLVSVANRRRTSGPMAEALTV